MKLLSPLFRMIRAISLVIHCGIKLFTSYQLLVMTELLAINGKQTLRGTKLRCRMKYTYIDIWFLRLIITINLNINRHCSTFLWAGRLAWLGRRSDCAQQEYGEGRWFKSAPAHPSFVLVRSPNISVRYCIMKTCNEWMALMSVSTCCYVPNWTRF